MSLSESEIQTAISPNGAKQYDIWVALKRADYGILKELSL